MSQTLGLNLLAKLLIEGRLSDYFHLNRDFFYDAELPVFDAIRRHHDEHGVLPSFTFLKERVEIEEPDSPEEYGVWHSEYVNRALFNRFNAVLPEVSTALGRRDSKGALDKIRALVEESHSITTAGQQDHATITEVGREVLAEYTRLRGLRGMSGIPSGYRTLDRTTHGFQNGDLILFAARPGVGKTTIAAKLALEAHSAGRIPLLVSMEMKKTQIGSRLIAMTEHLNMKTLRAGEMTTEVEGRIVQRIEVLNSLHPFYLIEGQFRKNINQLSSLVHSLCPNILIVDAAYLLKLPKEASRMPLWEKIGEIAQTLKTIAAVSNIPVIATFQINREGGKKDKAGKDAGLEHLQLSDALGQLASLIVGIFDDESDGLEETKERRLKILKGREGERGEFRIHYDFERMNFEEIIDAPSTYRPRDEHLEGDPEICRLEAEGFTLMTRPPQEEQQRRNRR